ncbi:MAG: hypothetical protein IH606_10930 [Burkholderiales bacterium]|nr:hypothetical protein [Burkholderiales bacterium]
MKNADGTRDMQMPEPHHSTHSHPVQAAAGDMKGMNMHMPEGPALLKAKNQAATANHAFLVKVLSLPDPIPFEKHFGARFAVFDGAHTDRRVPDAAVSVTAGMRHGMQSGFAHGMQYSPKIETKEGIVSITGLSFHMMGTWTLKFDIQQGGKTETAYLDLPCCAE